MKNKLAYDFLLHYYFKITTDSDYGEVFDSAIAKALRLLITDSK